MQRPRCVCVAITSVEFRQKVLPTIASILALLSCSSFDLHAAEGNCTGGSLKAATATPSSLVALVRDAACGTRVRLAAGDYDEDAVLHDACPDDGPLVLQSDTPGAARLRGKLVLTGSNLVVEGITVEGGAIELRGEHNRVTRSRFRSGGGIAVRGPRNRIDHNDFNPPGGNGIDIVFRLTKNDRRRVTDNLVDRNLFRTQSQATAAPGDQPEEDERRPDVGIYLGQFSARRGRTAMLDYGNTGNRVEYNLFQDFGRRRAIHIKSLGNEVRGNTILAPANGPLRAQLTVRSGADNEIVANWLSGRTALRIFEEDNRVIGNVLVDGAELLVMGGGGAMTDFAGPQQREARGTLLSGNRGPLRVGVTYAQRANLTPARDTVVEGHDGPVELQLETGTVVRAGPAAATAATHALTPAEVGPDAPDPLCD